jgi:hypothetical protein
LWQVLQVPEVTPAWLNVAPAKLTKLVWQVEQSAVVGTWFAGFATGVTP